MVAEGGDGFDGFDDVAAKIAGMRGGEAHPADAVELAHRRQQFGKVFFPDGSL